ncbi:CbiQ family ECF transporter T component [Rhodocyclaceae bacterium SMB388]
MHAGLLIFLWLTGVATLQVLELDWLLGAVLLCAVGALAYARARCLRLLRRIRFLLLAIVVLFAGFTPGEALFADWPSLSPSREGVWLAIEHAGRVLAVVFCVAMLMEHLPARRLVGGLYALLKPLERLGFPAARVAVRTLLVLEHVDARESVSWQSWLDDPVDDVHEPIRIVREPLRLTDYVVLGLVMVGLTVVVSLG